MSENWNYDNPSSPSTKAKLVAYRRGKCNPSRYSVKEAWWTGKEWKFVRPKLFAAKSERVYAWMDYPEAPLFRYNDPKPPTE